MEHRMKVYTGAHVLNTFSPILGFDTGGGDAHLSRDAHHVYISFTSWPVWLQWTRYQPASGCSLLCQ